MAFETNHFLPFSLTRDPATLRYGFFRFNERKKESYSGIKNPYHIIANNARAIVDDFSSLFPVPDSVVPAHIRTTRVHPIVIRSSARLENCIINSVDGPVFIDEDVLVMEGAVLRGPLFVGKGSIVKMGTAIYGGTTIGEYCVIGGEVKNSIFDDFTNKAHHGYIGDSYIGQWCNLGAGTSASNLKNTAGEINAWDMEAQGFRQVGQKCGILMGDHAKTAVDTVFNAGTVVGPYANIFDCQGRVPKFVPPFAWGVKTNEKYAKEKLVSDIERWMQMKAKKITQDIIDNINYLYV